MAHNKHPKNSLGFAVIFVPSEEMSWEDYKNKYGVDLDYYFYYGFKGVYDYNATNFTEGADSKVFFLSETVSRDRLLPNVAPVIKIDSVLVGGTKPALQLSASLTIDDGVLEGEYSVLIDGYNRIIKPTQL